ncbi:gliding motility-associated C-terminal domain-containing protein [Ilyomonas limi]|uniref:Gliding motility-associated C-terminal domain-containing protein n=1 Tax=Ilyomonas limi TaxID=2575867 RepID=A0A4U3KQ93_9BACT|nr:gliding motility-associated C-terminal domain-containing protein [Ilyomonas limi]TKK64475.1 gliding motility-associated C-terminal domain-containing protein [Ilyomonas limi]
MLSRALLLIFSILFLTVSATANTIVVTSSADAGAGTLRDALATAAANGTSVQDIIAFNLPDLTVNGRTIVLQTALPAISSNVVIDGTTQPGATFGISDAKVKIHFAPDKTDQHVVLFMQNADHVELYGLYITPGNINRSMYGIVFISSHHITIGKKGKGNLINGCWACITNNYAAYYHNTVHDITIQGNIIGYSETENLVEGNVYCINLPNAYNVTIGGPASGDGNLLAIGYTGALGTHVYLSYNELNTIGTFFARIQNNKFQTDAAGKNELDPSYFSSAIWLVGNSISSNDTLAAKTEILNNVVSGTILLQHIKHVVKIMGNKIGTDITGSSSIARNGAMVMVYNCFKVWIGSDKAEDINYFGSGSVQYFADGTKVLITKNKYLCGQNPIYIQRTLTQYDAFLPFCIISTYTDAVIAGTALPFSRIEMYRNDDCSDPNTCKNQTYVTTVYADAAGKWSYNGPQTPAMIATATSPDSLTSEFTAPKINSDSEITIQATCGKNNGAILGVKLSECTEHWWSNYHEYYNSKDTNIANLAPGEYAIYASIGKHGCKVVEGAYDIHDISPPDKLDYQNIEQPSCGLNTGSITTGSRTEGLTMTWRNSRGDSIGTGSSIYNLYPGTYMLDMYPSKDKSCLKTYGPFTLQNQSGPSLLMDKAVVTSALCYSNSGSITHIKATNITGTATYQWLDSTGNLVGSSPDLVNVPAGKYRLQFKDESSCEAIVSPFFTIADSGAVKLQTAGAVVKISDCSAANGAITNIVADNAASLYWIDTLSRTKLAATKDLLNVPTGFYKLFASSKEGCTDSTATFSIAQATANPISVVAATSTSETCARTDGEIRVDSIYPSSQDYTYEWTNESGNVVAGNVLQLDHLKAGYYTLYATDSNHCKQRATTIGVDSDPEPTIPANAHIAPATCGQKDGSITIPGITGSAPLQYTWYAKEGTYIGSTQSLVQVSAGDYYLVVKDAKNCISTSLTYTIKDTLVQLPAPRYNPLEVLKGEDATIGTTGAKTGTYELYSDKNTLLPFESNSTGVFSIKHLIHDTTVYVLVKTPVCRSDFADVHIKVIQKFVLLIPSAFTPNHDGLNDVFRLKYPQPVKHYRMVIYNRWGLKIFESTNTAKGWDGTVAGRDADTGTYIWSIEVVDETNTKQTYYGQVTLIR